MLWVTLSSLHVLPLLAGELPGVAPDSGSPSLYTYAFGWGPLGVFALCMGYLLLRRWRFISPAQEDKARESARTEGRADLIADRDRLVAENTRLLAENRVIADQRDDALRIAREQLMPLLVQFTAATQSLLPILQGLVSQGGWPRDRGGTR